MLISKLHSEFEKIDTSIAQDFLQLFLEASREHFLLLKGNLSEAELVKQERMLCQAETLLSIIIDANLSRQIFNNINKP